MKLASAASVGGLAVEENMRWGRLLDGPCAITWRSPLESFAPIVGARVRYPARHARVEFGLEHEKRSRIRRAPVYNVHSTGL